MAAIGLNVRADGSLDPSRLRGLNASWIRLVAIPEYDLREYFEQCRQVGLKILLVFAKESGEDYAEYFERYGALVHAIQVGNEPDLESDSSWTMSRDELRALGLRVRKAWPKPFPLLCGGLASGHPSWLSDLDLDWCDYLAVHPYAKDSANPNDVEDQPDVQDLLEAYRPFGKPLVVTEWGWPSDEEPRASEEVWDLVSWAADTSKIEAFFYFAAHGDVGAFGLWKEDGRAKKKAKAFRDAALAAVHSSFPELAPTQDLRAYARNAAAEAGWTDPDMFVRQIQQESGFNPNAHNAVSKADGIAQIVVRWHPQMDGRTRDPYASLNYAARWMVELYTYFGSWVKALAAYNWGPGNVLGWNNQPHTLPEETRRYLDAIYGPSWRAELIRGEVRFNASELAHPQEETYDCSQESLEWALASLDLVVDGEEMENAMLIQRVMSESAGLLDATGAGLAAFVNDTWGYLGYSANHDPGTSPDWTSLSFNAVAAEAGLYPLLIGGRGWYHWSGVRGYDATRDVLLLANPANGHKGVYQEMSREQFADLGPFSMVRVLHQDILAKLEATTESPPVVEPTPKPIIEPSPVLSGSARYSIWIYELGSQKRRLYEVNQSDLPPYPDNGELLRVVRHIKVDAFTPLDAAARVMSGQGQPQPLPVPQGK